MADLYDDIIIFGSQSGTTKEGKNYYKVAFAAKVQDDWGAKFTGKEATTALCSKEIYDVVSKCKSGDHLSGIVVRDKYGPKIFRLA